ncbi:MAG: hypothetical protein ACRD6N_00820 [Pyrinomonadaceae bacterium]
MNRQLLQRDELRRRITSDLLLRLPLLLAFALASGACGTIQPPETGGPRANQPVYPVVLSEDPPRREASLAAARQLLTQQGAQNVEVKLQPVTATIQSLPANQSVPLYLPKVGANPEMSEEETRESLRRFIESWRSLIGAEPSQLSLTEWQNQPNTTKLAAYEQRPFRYTLRGDYGKLQIQFAGDRRVLNVSSTCIPNTERLQNSLASITPVVKPEDAVKYVQENEITFIDSGGRQQTMRLAANTKVDAGELVYYVLPSAPDIIEFHLAWAVAVSDAPVKIVYLDAVSSKVIAAV